MTCSFGFVLPVVLLLSVTIQSLEAIPISTRKDTKCGTICPEIWSPVCGSNGEEYRMFPNDCELRTSNCWDKKESVAVFYKVKTDLCVGDSVLEAFAELSGIKNTKCDTVCPEVWSPVCGSDGEKFRIFTNDCEMRTSSCLEHKVFHAVKADLCESSVTLNGVLSQDIRDDLMNEDSVEDEVQKDCIVCPYIWRPVCGSDGGETKTFANQCMMDSENCLENRHFHTMRAGIC